MKHLTIIIALLLCYQSKATTGRGYLLCAIDNKKVSKFINKIWDDAELVSKRYNIPIGLLIAQVCLESKFGESTYAVKRNHFVGLKYNGAYAKFESRLDCFKAYGKMFQDDCYREIVPRTLNGWIYLLQSCGYATSKQYRRNLRCLIRKYHLDELKVGG